MTVLTHIMAFIIGGHRGHHGVGDIDGGEG